MQKINLQYTYLPGYVKNKAKQSNDFTTKAKSSDSPEK